ncbi:MAG: SIR2 family protein [Methanosarcinaceae archaeon]|nr:SIR2 family protein [Methanosarcinaceae archaeon]
MESKHPGFIIFFLGAGFSKPAGLPLATELYHKVKKTIEFDYGKDTKFQSDLESYIEDKKACDGIELDEYEIDLEDLMSFFDIEHFLGLRGKDTWSDEGNESQLMVRKAIGKVIHLQTPKADELPEAYHKFADSLSLHDIVITFNYDLVLERSLEYVGKPYRLFQSRYKSIGRHSNIVDNEKEEITILKLHGSLDWFNDKQFQLIKGSHKSQGVSDIPIHSVFDDPARYGAHPIVDGPRSPDDPLLNIYKIRDADSYYKFDSGFNSPFILSPSYVKFIYAPPILDFWHGLGRAGGYNLGISIIGFSLPEHDEYIRQILYNIISNYQESWWDERFLDTLKDNVKFVDFKSDKKSRGEYTKKYCFADINKSSFWFDGFSLDAVKFLFGNSRET